MILLSHIVFTYISQIFWEIVCIILPFATVLLNSVEITHKAFPFYNILQKFCGIFMLLSFLKLSTILVNPSTFVTPSAVLNLSILCQSSPSAVLGTGVLIQTVSRLLFHTRFQFELDCNSSFGSCAPSKHSPLWGFMFSIVLRVFQHWCCFSASALLIPSACHCPCQHLACSVSLPGHRF